MSSQNFLGELLKKYRFLDPIWAYCMRSLGCRTQPSSCSYKIFQVLLIHTEVSGSLSWGLAAPTVVAQIRCSILTWQHVKNAESQALSQRDWIKAYILIITLEEILFHPLLPPSHFAFSLSQNEDLFQSVCTRRPKYWSFSFSKNASKEYSGLISFRIE